jgi:hypothetical protein
VEYGKGRRERKEYTFGKKMEIEVNLRKLKESETKELLKKIEDILEISDSKFAI